MRAHKLYAVLAITVAAQAHAASPCYQWQGTVTTSIAPGTGGVNRSTEWLTSIDAARQAMVALCNQYGSCHTWCPTTLPSNCSSYGPVSLMSMAWPQVPAAQMVVTFSNGNTGASGASISNRANPAGCQVYVSAMPAAVAQCDACNSVGDPISPASASAHVAEIDLGFATSSLEFKRFYHSAAGQGQWRHSFSRSIKPVQSGSTYRAYVPSSDNSSLYSTESAACTSGFAQIKSRVSAWSNANAAYSGGLCTLIDGGTVIATLPIFYTSQPTPAPGSTVVIGFDVVRDDGRQIRFPVIGSTIIVPPSIKLKLQQISGGFTVTDADDNVETYDATGKLLSVVARSSVVQTLSYNTAGRLSAVADTFGRSLTLFYDTQGRLSSVVRQ